MLYFEQNFEVTVNKRVQGKFDEVYSQLQEEKDTNKIGYYKLIFLF